MDSKENSKIVGSKEAAEILGLSQSTISRYCREGIFKTTEHDAPGSPWRIAVEELKKFKKRRKK